jgi:hypothetical protein
VPTEMPCRPSHAAPRRFAHRFKRCSSVHLCLIPGLERVFREVTAIVKRNARHRLS